MRIKCNMDAQRSALCPECLVYHGHLAPSPACWRCGSDSWTAAVTDVRGFTECGPCFKAPEEAVRKGSFTKMAPKEAMAGVNLLDLKWMDRE
jgi:hypothetical protein